MGNGRATVWGMRRLMMHVEKMLPIDHICGAGGDHLSWGIKSKVVKTKRSLFLLFFFSSFEFCMTCVVV